MNLISPKFLQMCQAKKAKILKCLFEKEDVFAVVMEKNKMNFEEACEWIANDALYIDLPYANDSEIQMMQMCAKEMIKKLKENK